MRLGYCLLLSATLAVGTLGTRAQNAAEEDTELDVRVNPVLDNTGYDDDIDIPVPSYINRDANRIIMNGADWAPLRRVFEKSDKVPVSIVHIGDSHLQADISTRTTRELLQYDYGNAGRGLVTPFRIAGTNQPEDYTFSSKSGWRASKLMSRTWTYPMGFTGVSIHPVTDKAEFTVATNETDDYNPFSALTVFHGGRMTITGVYDRNGRELHWRSVPGNDCTRIYLGGPETRVTVQFTSNGDLTLYGASLEGMRPGLYYHTIGNNGATYATYNRIGSVGKGIAALQPDLVIISLGTNECFGTFSRSAFLNSVDMLVNNIKKANPDAEILLTTPIESSKRIANIQAAREALMDYGREHHVAVLDLWAVAGGRGASSNWIRNGMFARDNIHHTYRGYHLIGRLVYDALYDALTNDPQ